jgi:hypothetical protein
MKGGKNTDKRKKRRKKRMMVRGERVVGLGGKVE